MNVLSSRILDELIMMEAMIEICRVGLEECWGERMALSYCDHVVALSYFIRNVK